MTTNEVHFVLINLYNANVETEQVPVLNNLSPRFENLDINIEKKIILAEYFAFF